MLEQPRSTQRQQRVAKTDEEPLKERIVALACGYGRYGYRRVTALLRSEGWRVNHKRVERLWRQEGLKVRQRQPKRKRLWLNDGSCIRLRPLYRNHVWSYDFVAERTTDGRPIRMLNIIDEYTRECLAVFVAWIAAEIYRSDFRRICAIRFGQRGLQEDAFAKLVAIATTRVKSFLLTPTFYKVLCVRHAHIHLNHWFLASVFVISDLIVDGSVLTVVWDANSHQFCPTRLR